MKYTYILYSILFSLSCGLGALYAQELPKNIPDSLLQKTYTALEDVIFATEEDDTQTLLIYAAAYLTKAKAKKDSLNIGRGFKYLSFVSSDTLAYQYADSIIHYTQSSNHKYFPARGYMIKGIRLYRWGDYDQALDNFLIAYNYAQKQQSTDQLMEIRYNIGAIKESWGAYEEALDIFKENLKAIQAEENYKTKYTEDYLVALRSVYVSYMSNQKIDSARLYIKKGIAESLALKDSVRYYGFVLGSGIADYLDGNYTSAIDSIDKALPYIRKKKHLIIGSFYKGKTFYALQQKDSMIYYFKKVDSTYQIIKSEFPELREMYQLLAEYYKAKNDVPQQLHYINKLLEVDSILMHNYKYLNKNIVQKYDTPYLMAEKENLIEQLHQDKSRLGRNLVIIIIVAIGLLLSVWMYYRKRQQQYQQRFQNLLERKKEAIPTQATAEKQQSKLKTNEVPEAIAQNILDKLAHFEATEAYLDNTISLHGLAKQLETNSAYLSKTVNVYKSKNFTTYINELRVDYAIEKLKTDTTFRKYVVKVIAYEVGFKSTESFSKTFYKKTGIYPSYFIKQLQEQEYTHAS